MTEATATPVVPESDIHDILNRIDDGALYAQLCDDLTEIVSTLRKRVGDHGGEAKGKLSLALAFHFDGKLMEIAPTVKIELPRPKHGKGVFWATKDNRLSPQNPQQIDAFATRDVAFDKPLTLTRKA